MDNDDMTFEQALTNLINGYSIENGSDTPDFILAAYIAQSLAAFNHAVNDREQWYGRLTDGLPKATSPKKENVNE